MPSDIASGGGPREPTMIAMGAVCVAAALVTGMFVSDDRMSRPHLAAHPRTHGCALSVSTSAVAS